MINNCNKNLKYHLPKNIAGKQVAIAKIGKR